jgi:5-methylcytosine-specific restriction protein A
MKLPTLRSRLEPARPKQSAGNPRRIRGKGLQTIRRRVLSSRPLCVKCEARGIVRPATEVDHIVPLSEGGLEHDTNRQPLCADCHAEKTAGEARRRGGRS